MLIPLDKLISDYNLKIKGVIHIGAHYGQEYPSYLQCGIKNMMFFEPIAANYKRLMETIPEDIKNFNIALGNETGKREMYVETTNEGMSCSLFEPEKHLEQYPDIIFDKKEIVNIDKLDNIEFDRNEFNMINIDVQGYELEVFKGAIKTLSFTDIIYTEVNFEEVYKNCCLVGQLDDFLGNFGFLRVLTDNTPKTWGDALYIKQ